MAASPLGLQCHLSIAEGQQGLDYRKPDPPGDSNKPTLGSRSLFEIQMFTTPNGKTQLKPDTCCWTLNIKKFNKFT